MSGNDSLLAEAVELIRDLVDPDACWFDHHGGCQAHGYLSLEPGEICPQQQAKDFLERIGKPLGAAADG